MLLPCFSCAARFVVGCSSPMSPQAIGGEEARLSDMTTKRVAELDERDHQLERRMAELRDELSAIQQKSVSAAELQRAVVLFEPVWGLLLVAERHLAGSAYDLERADRGRRVGNALQ